MVHGKQHHPGLKKEEDTSLQPEKKWDNPKDPENAEDERDLEKVRRQKKEAERRKDNLTTEENTE